MKSYTTAKFWGYMDALPPEIQRRAYDAYDHWLRDPRHPSLQFKKVGERTWSVRITEGYRALALLKDGALYWHWIGPHDEYELIIGAKR